MIASVRTRAQGLRADLKGHLGKFNDRQSPDRLNTVMRLMQYQCTILVVDPRREKGTESESLKGHVRVICRV